MRLFLIALGLVLGATASAAAASPSQIMVELTLRGQRIEGLPIAWDRAQVYLLGRDGRIWEFRPDEASQFRKSADRFQPASVSELRAVLLREMGPGYEVSGTGHFLVVHPAGRRDAWAQRFEDHYRSFVHFCGVRGLKVSEPLFPLVAIACRTRSEFQRLAAGQGIPAQPGFIGFYVMDSNWILLYDVGEGRATTSDWKQNAATVVHEATHQVAFNTGIHSRYAPPPTWLAEGLGMVFETRDTPKGSDRVTRERLKWFKDIPATQRNEVLADLIVRDDLFHADPATAYSASWAMSNYLFTTQARKYADFLALTARRKAFSPYPADQRLSDFKSVFGGDLRMLAAQVGRFVESLH